MTHQRKNIPQKIKNTLLVEAMHRCCLCPQHENITEIHHIVPINEKGPDTEENLMVVCPNCHEKIHRIRTMYTPVQLKMYKDRWIDLCSKGITLEELLKQAPGIPLYISHSLHNQTPPEPDFVGRKEMLQTITKWYKNPEVRIGALIGWGGVGKSAMVRKWFDSMEQNNIKPDSIFWWGFYRNAYLEQFLNTLLRHVSQGQIEPETIKSTWQKIERIKEYIHQGSCLIILDGLEQMQKSESGDQFGRMIHRECTELLHYLADLPKADGLCMITTRYPLKDLNEWHENSFQNHSIIGLSIPDSLSMLKKRGVRGTDKELTQVINRYKAHALSLTSLAGYLNKYYEGDIKHAPNIEYVLSDEERFKDVNKLLRRYAEKMSDSERIFLNIFSLFRSEVTENDFKGLFRYKMEDTRFNEALINMNELDFTDLIIGLKDWRLISYDEIKNTYTIHPLIKSYFESNFNENNKKLCHKRMYHYFGENAPEQSETLEEMQPLFEQVYHACSAGIYDEVCDNVYWEKIYRKEEFFIYHKLGAWETNLSLARTFFPEQDLSKMPLVIKKNAQSWLLNEAGLALKNIGRPKEAEKPFLAGVKMDIEDKDWKNASIGYRNLADLQFRTGELESGLDSVRNALNAAENTTSNEYIINPKAYFAWIFHLLGKYEDAEKEFRQADELEGKISGDRLYSQSGVFYADFLISMNRINEASELTKQNLEICQRDNVVNDISRCLRCLGTIERIKANHKEAENHLQNALNIARKVGMPYLEIEVQLESGRLHSNMKKHKNAVRDANEVLNICARTGFKLYEPDAEIVLSKANLALKNIEQARTFAHSAYEKAIKMHYRWPEGDAACVLGEIYLALGDKAKARQWLKKSVACRKEISDPKVKDAERMLKT